MHQVIVESLEEYLGGTLAPAAQRDFKAHLESCEACRREVAGMAEMATWFEPLRQTETLEIPPGFYARVMQQVGRSQVPSLWSFFSLDAAFGRRVAFASLLTLAVLGSFLVARETSYAPGPPNPETVMADQATSRESMLVTLTSYEP